MPQVSQASTRASCNRKKRDGAMMGDSTDSVTSTLVVPVRPKSPCAHPPVLPPVPDDWRRAFAAMQPSRGLILAETGGGAGVGVVGSRFLKPTDQAGATARLAVP